MMNRSLTAAELPVAPDRRGRRLDDFERRRQKRHAVGRPQPLTLIAAFCAALAWASLGKVDMIAAAPGKIIPSGRSKIVQPFDTGVVRATMSPTARG
jgi:hypothetical protein